MPNYYQHLLHLLISKYSQDCITEKKNLIIFYYILIGLGILLWHRENSLLYELHEVPNQEEQLWEYNDHCQLDRRKHLFCQGHLLQNLPEHQLVIFHVLDIISSRIQIQLKYLFIIKKCPGNKNNNKRAVSLCFIKI